MARLDHRTNEDYRSPDQSHGTWRERIRCFPFGDSVDARIRVFRQAHHDRLGPRAYRTCLDRADEAPWIHEALWRKAAIGVRLSVDMMGVQAPRN